MDVSASTGSDQLNSTDNKSSSTTDPSTDWSLCILCQKSSNVQLMCPADSKRKDAGAGYNTLYDDLSSFLQMGHLPSNIKLERFDDGHGIATTLANHKAKWHKNCRDMYNQTKLMRLQKRKSEGSSPSTSSDHTVKRSRTHYTTSQKSENVEPVCFFCDETGKSDDLRSASTFGLNAKVRAAALCVGDTKLLAKLSEGDVIAIEMKYHLKCLVSLYNKAKAVEHQQPHEDQICVIV